MKALEIDLPRPEMGRLPEKPGKLRRYLRSVSRTMEDNQIVRDFLVAHGLVDQIPWV